MGDDYAFSTVGIYYQIYYDADIQADVRMGYDSGGKPLPSAIKNLFEMTMSSSADFNGNYSYYLSVWSVHKDSKKPDAEKVEAKTKLTDKQYADLKNFYDEMKIVNFDKTKPEADMDIATAGFKVLSILKFDISADNIPVHQRKDELSKENKLPKEKIKIK